MLQTSQKIVDLNYAKNSTWLFLRGRNLHGRISSPQQNVKFHHAGSQRMLDPVKSVLNSSGQKCQTYLVANMRDESARLVHPLMHRDISEDY